MPAKKLTTEQMHQRAQERGGLCLSEKYIDFKTPLLWQCARGHQWFSAPTNIKHGAWCPECGLENKRLTIEEMHQIAHSRGGLCLSSTYSNEYNQLQWQCAAGHQWQATPHNIKRGTWCVICLHDSLRLTLQEMQALAEQRGGTCLSRRYLNSNTLLQWCCAKGHIWKAAGNTIKSGSWCRQCHSDSMRGTLEEMHLLAKAKGGECLSTEYVDAHTRLQWQCAKGHQWLALPGVIKKSWCFECSVERKRLGIDRMREIAAQHGGRCLSDTYKNRGTDLTWQCIEGHIWQARPHGILKGQWCPICYRIRALKQKEINMTKKKRRIGIPGLI